jgi:drug/metabolite transporter (DMT)-like permease
LSNAIVLFYTFPLFVVFFSFLFFRTTIELGELSLIGLGLTGIYILINPGFHSFNTGYIFGILSSCIGGMAMVFAHKARQTNGPLIIYFYFCLVGGILSLPSFVRGFKIPNAQHGILLISLSLTLLIGQVLMNYALKFCKASEGALIMMSEVVFAGVAAILIFRDPISLNFLIGAILIMGSGIGLNLMGRKSRRSPAFSEENMDK